METYVCVPQHGKDIRRIFNTMVISRSDSVTRNLRRVLENRGHNVTICSESLECLSICVKKKYNIIFIDAEQNEVISNCLAQLIKGIDNNENIYVFSLVDKLNERSSMLDGVIQKPLDNEKLHQLLNHLEIGIKLQKHVLNFV